MSLTIWTNVSYPPAVMDRLRAGIGDHTILLAGRQEYSNLAKPADDPNLPAADIAFGQPAPEQLLTSPKVKWVQITSAGYTNYDRDDLKIAFRQRGAIFSNSSSVYAEPCAQHLLSMMLSQARKLPVAMANQLGAHTWLYREIREQSVLLNGQNVLLVGFGAIGRRIAELLKPLDMRITAVRRNPVGDEAVVCRPIEELPGLLPSADHIVNLLPLNPATQRIFGADAFARLKRSAVFYNVGRGQTVDQPALQTALSTGIISAAWLDVTDPEPLPPEHPLWSTPNCFITPHTAGGHTSEFFRVVEHFLSNLQRFESRAPVRDRVF